MVTDDIHEKARIRFLGLISGMPIHRFHKWVSLSHFFNHFTTSKLILLVRRKGLQGMKENEEITDEKRL